MSLHGRLEGRRVRPLRRHVLTDGTVAIVDLGGFMVLVALDLPIPVAASLSFLAANVANHLLTARFVFSVAPTIRRYPMFLATASAGFTIDVVTALATWALSFEPAMAKLVGTGVAFVANFFPNAEFVFPATPRTSDSDPQ